MTTVDMTSPTALDVLRRKDDVIDDQNRAILEQSTIINTTMICGIVLLSFVAIVVIIIIIRLALKIRDERDTTRENYVRSDRTLGLPDINGISESQNG